MAGQRADHAEVAVGGERVGAVGGGEGHVHGPTPFSQGAMTVLVGGIAFGAI